MYTVIIYVISVGYLAESTAQIAFIFLGILYNRATDFFHLFIVWFFSCARCHFYKTDRKYLFCCNLGGGGVCSCCVCSSHILPLKREWVSSAMYRMRMGKYTMLHINCECLCEYMCEKLTTNTKEMFFSSFFFGIGSQQMSFQ